MKAICGFLNGGLSPGLSLTLLTLGLVGCQSVGSPRSNVAGCVHSAGSTAPTENAELTLVVLGDIGTGEQERNKEAAAALREFLRARRLDPDGILVLGDNFYPNGLVGVETWCLPGRRRAPDGSVTAQLTEIVTPYQFLREEVTSWVLPGNHDYGCREMGSVRNQMDIDRWLPAEQAWGDRWQLVDGLPRELIRSPLVHVIALDTTLMITDPSFLDDAAEELERMLRASPARWRMVAGHHPLYANGEHDGAWWQGAVLKILYYPSFALLFPAQLHWLVYSGQNVYELPYQRYRQRLEAIFARYRVDVFLAGHEHALEWLTPSRRGQPFMLISWAGAQCGVVMQRPNTLFSASKNGFAVISASMRALQIDFIGTTACGQVEQCAQPSRVGEWHQLFPTAISAKSSAQ